MEAGVTKEAEVDKEQRKELQDSMNVDKNKERRVECEKEKEKKY